MENYICKDQDGNLLLSRQRTDQINGISDQGQRIECKHQRRNPDRRINNDPR